MSADAKLIIKAHNHQALDFMILWEDLRQAMKKIGAYGSINALGHKVLESNLNASIQGAYITSYYPLYLCDMDQIRRNLFLIIGPKLEGGKGFSGAELRLGAFGEAEQFFLQVARHLLPEYEVWFTRNDLVQEQLQLDLDVVTYMLECGVA